MRMLANRRDIICGVTLTSNLELEAGMGSIVKELIGEEKAEQLGNILAEVADELSKKIIEDIKKDGHGVTIVDELNNVTTTHAPKEKDVDFEAIDKTSPEQAEAINEALKNVEIPKSREKESMVDTFDRMIKDGELEDLPDAIKNNIKSDLQEVEDRMNQGEHPANILTELIGEVVFGIPKEESKKILKDLEK